MDREGILLAVFDVRTAHRLRREADLCPRGFGGGFRPKPDQYRFAAFCLDAFGRWPGEEDSSVQGYGDIDLIGLGMVLSHGREQRDLVVVAQKCWQHWLDLEPLR